MKFNILFSLAIVLFFTACGGESATKKGAVSVAKAVTEISGPSEIMTSIQSKKWILTDYQYKDKGHLIEIKKVPFLIFRDSKVSGFGGCSVFMGSYIEGANMGLNFKINNNNISCEYAREEANYISLLQNTSEYSLSEDKSKLKLTAADGVLNFSLQK